MFVFILVLQKTLVFLHHINNTITTHMNYKVALLCLYWSFIVVFRTLKPTTLKPTAILEALDKF